MDSKELKKSILNSRNKTQWNWIVDSVVDEPVLYRSLVQYALSGDYTITLRASWLMDKIAEKEPGIVMTCNAIEKIIEKLPSESNFSVIRACLRMLSRYELVIDNCVELVDSCFKWLKNPGVPIAVKVHSMQLLYYFTLPEPELKNELTIIIEDQLPIGSAGFVSRGKKILKQLKTISS